MSSVLAFENVAFVTGEVRLLDGLSFALAAGERLAICGDSGRGKSMIARLALRLSLPLSGTVRLFGEETAALDAEALRRLRWRCGASFQGGSLIGDLDVEDNLLLGVDLTGDLRGQVARKLDRLIYEFQLDHIAHAKVHALSISERQRVELARAFLRDPELVILDEPLAGAQAQAAQIEARIRRQVHLRGRAMLLLTQDIALAHRLADHVLCIEQGRLVQHVAGGTAPVVTA